MLRNTKISTDIMGSFKCLAKIHILCIAFYLLHGVNPVLAQELATNIKISVDYKDTSLKQILKDISKKSGTKFSYNSKAIPLDTLISYKCAECELEKVLKGVFQKSGLKYEHVENHVVLKVGKLQKLEIEPPSRKKQYTISGYITDAKNQEALIGAAVFNAETNVGTTTNNYGFFSLTLPEGAYKLETSYLGYTVKSETVQLFNNYKWNINLQPVASMVDEIIVSSVDKEALVFRFLAAQTEINPIEVKKQTAVLGETDMLKSFDNLPGISFQSDGSSYFYVRGGNRDQNLILLDEAPIYNPSHMLGLFTPIIPDAVKTTNIYKADFPIQYGGRLSSLVDIRTKDGNMERFSGSGSLGLASTRFSIEGPIKKQSSSYFVSYRRSHFGMFIKAAQPNIKDFYFTDFTAKVNLRLGKKDRLFLTMYKGGDKFITEESEAVAGGLEWGNTSLTLRWNHLYSDRLFSNTTFYTSRYNYFMYTDYDKKEHWNSRISSGHLKSEFSWFLNPGNQINYGIKLGSYFFNPGNHNSPELPLDYTVSPNNSFEFIAYAGNEINITEKLLLNYGIRFTNWSNSGKAFVVNYDENYKPLDFNTYEEGETYYSTGAFEPRISFSYKSGKYASFKASYNRTLQHVNLINNSISPFNSLEVWLPSGPNIKPQKANIYNLGYAKVWPLKNIEFNADIYYKTLYNQIGYAYHAKTLLNPYLEGELRQGDGKAYGFELLLKKTQGRFTGQLGYGFTRSLLQIDGLNGGREYKARPDRPVDFSLAIGYSVKPRWVATLNFMYASGMRITTPTSFYYYRGSQVPVYSEQNNGKLPDYKRIDIGSDFKLNKGTKNFEHHLVISVFNFFGYKNPAFLYTTKTSNADGNFEIPMDKLNMQEQIVTKRYVFSVIPSITYNLKF
ncbi:MAG: TonB-dependent receptor [Salinivirgaceae bacterium]|jgi:hypothetical protein|nr:TonB-dependent receptor [Salinivirgaceae bacterium]